MPTLELMNQKGRIGVCGAIAGYNDESPVLSKYTLFIFGYFKYHRVRSIKGA